MGLFVRYQQTKIIKSQLTFLRNSRQVLPGPLINNSSVGGSIWKWHFIHSFNVSPEDAAPFLLQQMSLLIKIITNALHVGLSVGTYVRPSVRPFAGVSI